MDFINISTKISIHLYDELNPSEKMLIEAAKQSATKAYAPYSHFQVGVAVYLDNGKIVTGNNQENVAYPSGLCAERVAVFYANAQYPEQAVKQLAIAAFTNNEFTAMPITPCGACRQVLLETENRFQQTIQILLYGREKIYIIQTIRDLLPLSFESI